MTISPSPAESPVGRAVRTDAPPATLGLDVDPSGRGTFSVEAPRACAVDLCVLDEHGRERRIPLRRDGGRWWAPVEGMTPGTRYGLRADGTWDPARGARFSHDQLLLDPRGRGTSHRPALEPSLFAHEVTDELWPVDGRDVRALRRRRTDNGARAPWSVVVPHDPGAAGERPRTSWRDTVLYEAHVRGFSALNPDVPADLRGTYAGLAHPASIRHLTRLGITAIELLPIHASLDEPHLARLGLPNYWGYSTLSFFAPEPSYATESSRTAGAVAVADEVRGMVRALHDAGIEVVLDVVYNHTAEGDEFGPALSFRGLDAHEHYWHEHDEALGIDRLVDATGTGSTFDPRSTAVHSLVLDSLRHWAHDYGIDGFRFDLAATLGRDDRGFRADHPLLRAIAADPVLRDRKLIAEPWDIGPGGWQTGAFGAPWAEWNDGFRDDIREFWLSAAGRRAAGHRSHVGVRALATRLAGSADMLRGADPWDLPAGASLRGPWAGISFLTAHDGFTLRDLTVYDRKHNRANGEDGRDGTDANRSWNHGVEGSAGPDAPTVEPHRRRTARSLLATLLLSSGTPMLTAGDERARTQRGNNNAYCQDNDISWMSWERSDEAEDLTDVTAALIGLRARFPQLRAASFLGPLDPAAPSPDAVGWFGLDGREMDDGRWADDDACVLQMLRPGGPGAVGALVIVNGGECDASVTVPSPEGMTGPAALLFSSAEERPLQAPIAVDRRAGLDVPARSVLLVALEPGV